MQDRKAIDQYDLSLMNSSGDNSEDWNSGMIDSKNCGLQVSNGDGGLFGNIGHLH